MNIDSDAEANNEDARVSRMTKHVTTLASLIPLMPPSATTPASIISDAIASLKHAATVAVRYSSSKRKRNSQRLGLALEIGGTGSS